MSEVPLYACGTAGGVLRDGDVTIVVTWSRERDRGCWNAIPPPGGGLWDVPEAGGWAHPLRKADTARAVAPTSSRGGLVLA